MRLTLMAAGGAMVLLGASGSDAASNNVTANLAMAGVQTNEAAPAPATNQAAPVNGSADAGAPGSSELRAFIVGRWTPAESDCEQPMEFQADGAAIRAPGAPADRWTLVREGSNDVIRIESAGQSQDAVVVRQGDRLSVAPEGGEPVVIRRC